MTFHFSRGKTIAIRRVKSTSKFQLTKKVRKEVKQVRYVKKQIASYSLTPVQWQKSCLVKACYLQCF